MHILLHFQIQANKDINNHVTWSCFSVPKYRLTCSNETKFSPKAQYTVEIYFYTVEGGGERMAHDLEFPYR